MKSWYFNGKKVRRPDSLYLNGCTYVPPTDEQLTEFGYEMIEEEDETRESNEFFGSYEQTVSHYIHERYSIDDEIAILRQRDSKPEEFEEYNSFCEHCKFMAKEVTENA